MGSYLHFLFLTAYIILLSTQGQGQGHEQGQLIIDRHNYGFTLTKTGSLGLTHHSPLTTTARAQMLFHFAIRAAYNIRMSDYIMYGISSEQNRTEQQQHNKQRTVFGRGHQQKTVYRLADNILFLSNISKIHVNCASHNFTDVIPVQKPQMRYFLYSVVVGLSLTPYFITVLRRIVLKIKTFQTVYKYHTA